MNITLKTVSSLLLRFTPQQLEQLVPIALGVDWEDVSKFIFQNKLCFQKKYVVEVSLLFYEKKKPSKSEIEKVIWTLKLYDVSTHESETWHCIKPIEQFKKVSDLNGLENSLLSAYKCEARNAEILMLVNEPLLFLLVAEKKITTKGIKHLRPIFFAIHSALPEQFLFYTPKLPDNYHLEFICKALGYSDFTSVPLFGKDIFNLYLMIERKFEQEDNFLDIPNFEPGSVIEGDGFVDFTLGNERSKYADNLLPGTTKLNTFAVHANNEWRGDTAIPELADEKVLTALTFTSSSKKNNVEDMFKHLIKYGIVQFPTPSYIAALPRIAQNEISLKTITQEESE